MANLPQIGICRINGIKFDDVHRKKIGFGYNVLLNPMVMKPKK